MFEVGKRYRYFPPSLNGQHNGGSYYYIGLSKEGAPVFQSGPNIFVANTPERYREHKEPLTLSGWVNVYETHTGAIHATRQNADDNVGTQPRKACIYIFGEEKEEPSV